MSPSASSPVSRPGLACPLPAKLSAPSREPRGFGPHTRGVLSAAAPPELTPQRGWAPGLALCPVSPRAPPWTRPCARAAAPVASDGLGWLGRPKLCPGSNPLTLPLSLVSFPGTFPPLQLGLGVLLTSVARSLPSLRERLLPAQIL